MIKKLYGYDIEITTELQVYAKYRRMYLNYANMGLDSYCDFYKKNIVSLEGLLVYTPRYVDFLLEKIIGNTIETLVDCGIVNINEERFRNNYSKYFNIDKYLKPIKDQYHQITRAGENLKLQREMERSSRSSWSGGGFGLSGALKGAAMASAMNAGTGFFRSIGDSHTDSKDASLISDAKDSILQNEETIDQVLDGVFNCCFGVFY